METQARGVRAPRKQVRNAADRKGTGDGGKNYPMAPRLMRALTFNGRIIECSSLPPINRAPGGNSGLQLKELKYIDLL